MSSPSNSSTCTWHPCSPPGQVGRRGGPLARTTLHDVSTILRQALGNALRGGRLDDNVAARARPPRLDPDRHTEPRALHSWDAAQAARFLELTSDIPPGGLWHVALGTGMRRGELLDPNVPIKVVAERLGHAKSSTTMGIYAHVRPAQERDAAQAPTTAQHHPPDHRHPRTRLSLTRCGYPAPRPTRSVRPLATRT